MPNHADPNLKKIFPRNLTANAATRVRGNPANARPESGVDNTHPGLEFDQRNLDKAFFPGLVFEFQFLQGARLVEVHRERFQPPNELQQSDLRSELYLYYVCGRFGALPEEFRLVELHRTDGCSDGYEVLRTIRDLEPGPVMVVVGPKDPLRLARLGATGGFEFAGLVRDPTPPSSRAPGAKLFRDPATNELLAAVFVGDRCPYVDAKGVIAQSAAPPGELTRSLCAPWQWDFADCGCHYWAANKPDIVFGPDEKTDKLQILNFQRNRTDPPKDPSPIYQEWTTGQMTQQEMIRAWETLPFVIAERETTRAVFSPRQGIPDPWTQQRVIEELTYLASIEHALCIEYLYAFFSLNAPRELPGEDGPPQARDVFTAAQLVRSIAIDEMRHFRWANEALALLNAPITVARADNFNPHNKPGQISGHFKLDALTPERLDAFIKIEAPSRSINQAEKLDGLYTHLLLSLGDDASEIDLEVRKRLAEIVKLIIDEGHEHWERFKKVKDLLAPYSSGDYLRVAGEPVAPPPGDANAEQISALQLTADWNYRLIIEGVTQAFADDRAERANHIRDARLTMFNLDDIGQELAGLGYGMFFHEPDFDPGATALQLGRVNAALGHLKTSHGGSTRPLALRQIAQMYARLHD